MSIDLHCHSSVSDGALRPSELVRAAHANGASMLALTDHDHTGGLEEARAEAAKIEGFRFINGVEVSVTWREHTIHVVGLDFDPANEAMQEALKKNRSGRLERLRKIADLFNERTTIRGVYNGALKYAKNPEMVGRAHIAEYLLEKRHVRNKQLAFDLWLGPDKKCYVKDKWMSLEKCVSMILGAGGIPVIAHPARYPIEEEELLEFVKEFVDLGGMGIEVACHSHNLDERLKFALMAGRFGLYASTGSDFHREYRKGPVLGCPPELPMHCKPVWNIFKDAREQAQSQEVESKGA